MNEKNSRSRESMYRHVLVRLCLHLLACQGLSPIISLFVRVYHRLQ